MSKLYGKEVINKVTIDLNGEYIEVFALDDGEWINYHVLSGKFKRDELNTLELQEPKECGKTDDIFLNCLGIQFLLWNQFYGFNNKNYTFNIEIVEETEL